jgi:hypothetical protein
VNSLCVHTLDCPALKAVLNSFFFAIDLNLFINIIEQDFEKRAPITVKFEIPYFTVSGIQVRYLKIVEKSGYQALPWVRYITQNGDDYRSVVFFFLVCYTFFIDHPPPPFFLVCGQRWKKEVLQSCRCNPNISYHLFNQSTCIVYSWTLDD